MADILAGKIAPVTGAGRGTGEARPCVLSPASFWLSVAG